MQRRQRRRFWPNGLFHYKAMRASELSARSVQEIRYAERLRRNSGADRKFVHRFVVASGESLALFV